MATLALVVQVVRQHVCVSVVDVITCVTMSSCQVASLSSQMSEKKNNCKMGGNEESQEVLDSSQAREYPVSLSGLLFSTALYQ